MEIKKIYLARIVLKIYKTQKKKLKYDRRNAKTQKENATEKVYLLNRIIYEVYKDGNELDGTLNQRIARDLDLKDGRKFEIEKIEKIKEVGYENGESKQLTKIKLDVKDEAFGNKDWFKNM